MEKYKIQYCCFLSQSGYSVAAQDYIMALKKANKYDIKVRSFGNTLKSSYLTNTNLDIFSEMKNKKYESNYINIYHCIPPMQKRVAKASKNIGFATFETYSPPEEWKRWLNSNDAIIVPSLFNYEIFNHMGIEKPIYYIPHCFDPEIYNIDIEALRNYKRFTFLFVGAWKIRKGYIQLIEAFLKEFDEKDNVQLIIKTDKHSKAQKYVQKIKDGLNKKGFAPILFEKEVLDSINMAKFLKSADCLVQPTLGEGFGLSGMQCMAVGTPIIITDFSGCLDYANEDNCLLFKKGGFTLHNSMDNIPQFRNKKWAFISVKEIRKKMRYAVDNYGILKKKSKNGYEFVHNNFSYEKIGKKFNELLGNL